MLMNNGLAMRFIIYAIVFATSFTVVALLIVLAIRLEQRSIVRYAQTKLPLR
jgi:hypothetical protein